jgi:hypothetical protein
MSTHLNVAAITDVQIDAAGTQAEFHAVDEAGRKASLVLSMHCLNQLLRSAPGLIQTMARRSQGDDSLRLTYPLKGFSLEAGDLGDECQQLILSLHSVGDFVTAFSAAPENLARLARSILQETQPPVGTCARLPS